MSLDSNLGCPNRMPSLYHLCRHHHFHRSFIFTSYQFNVSQSKYRELCLPLFTSQLGLLGLNYFGNFLIGAQKELNLRDKSRGALFFPLQKSPARIAAECQVSLGSIDYVCFFQFIKLLVHVSVRNLYNVEVELKVILMSKFFDVLIKVNMNLCELFFRPRS